MTDDREKIAARIRALLAKTVANGCTEDEALAAAQKAAEMLARYNLTVDEVEMRASPFTQEGDIFDGLVGERMWKIAAAVAHLTDTRYWTSPAGVVPVAINFFGFDHEVAVARYLLVICANAMNTEQERMHANYALLVANARRRKIIPYLDGMADRLHQRIRKMKPPAPTGRGLVVLRNQLIDDAMEQMKLKLSERATRGSRDREAEYLAGVRAGDGVALNTAMSAAKSNTRGLLA